MRVEDRVQVIDYNGAEFFYTDLSRLSAEEGIKVLEYAMVEMPKRGPKSTYSLLNVKHLEFNADIMKTFNKVSVDNKPYVIALAICGVSSMTRLLGKGVIKASGRKANFFTDVEEGKEWLHGVVKGAN